MTFRELLELYRAGELTEDQRAGVEAEIEKHEAISDYLYEEPPVEELSPPELSQAGADEAQKFTRLVQGAIRRAFVKMGVIVGVVTLAVVLAVIFVLPEAVSSAYYDPSQLVGISEYGQETNRMSLDLAVYSELCLPGRYRNSVFAEAEGYGEYRVTIHQNVSLTGSFTTLNGRLERGELTLYTPDYLRPPTGNAFVLPDDVEWNYRGHGAAGSPEYAFAALEKLDEGETYIGYFSLKELMDYEDFDAAIEEGRGIWTAVYTGRRNGHLGFGGPIGGALMSWDREKYPLLSGLDSAAADHAGAAANAGAEDEKTHFLSMLRYLQDHPEVVELFGGMEENWQEMIDYVEEHGLQIYGFAVAGDKQLIQSLAAREEVAYVYTEPLN